MADPRPTPFHLIAVMLVLAGQVRLQPPPPPPKLDLTLVQAMDETLNHNPTSQR